MTLNASHGRNTAINQLLVNKQQTYANAQLHWHSPTGRHRVTLASVHLDFLSRKTRDSQVAQMIAALSGVDGPLIVLGDFNSGWQGQNSALRRLAEDLDLQAFAAEQAGLGTYKKSTGKRLDWILISRDLEFMSYKVLPEVVADHFAVYAEVAYRERAE